MYWCAHKTATLTSIQHTVLPPYVLNHVFSTENNQKLAFSDPLPPTSDYVIHEWSLTWILQRFIWILPAACNLD